MQNKEEIIYNTQSLVSVWLEGKEYKDLIIELDGDVQSVIKPTTKENCGKDAGEMLAESGKKYQSLKLTGVIDGERNLIGQIDIK